MVWNGSKKLGIGRFVKKNGPLTCTYVVARYRPAGNMLSKYDENVKKGSFDAGKTCKDVDNIAGIKDKDKGSKRVGVSPTNKRQNGKCHSFILKKGLKLGLGYGRGSIVGPILRSYVCRGLFEVF